MDSLTRIPSESLRILNLSDVGSLDELTDLLALTPNVRHVNIKFRRVRMDDNFEAKLTEVLESSCKQLRRFVFTQYGSRKKWTFSSSPSDTEEEDNE